MTNIFKLIYIRSTGYSYTNMGRLFLRLFVGVMLMQSGLRQLYNFAESAAHFPATLGMDAESSLTVMIIIELLCSLCIMAGFCTRLMTIPPFLAMILAEHHLLSNAGEAAYMISWTQPVSAGDVHGHIFLYPSGRARKDFCRLLPVAAFHPLRQPERVRT